VVVEVAEVVTAMYGHLHHLAAVRYQHVMADRGAAIARDWSCADRRTQPSSSIDHRPFGLVDNTSRRRSNTVVGVTGPPPRQARPGSLHRRPRPATMGS
jgi:hypothetical protein